MDTLAALWNRLRALFRREQIDRDLEEEMRFHVEMRARENLEAGMSEAEARRAAHRAFGNRLLAEEDSRHVWTFTLVETFLQDLRYGARTLWRNPVFAGAVILTLALGIGANTAIFTLLDTVVLRRAPRRAPRGALRLRHPDRRRRHPHRRGLGGGLLGPGHELLLDSALPGLPRAQRRLHRSGRGLQLHRQGLPEPRLTVGRLPRGDRRGPPRQRELLRDPRGAGRPGTNDRPRGRSSPRGTPGGGPEPRLLGPPPGLQPGRDRSSLASERDPVHRARRHAARLPGGDGGKPHGHLGAAGHAGRARAG